jgi:aconitate hydratase
MPGLVERILESSRDPRAVSGFPASGIAPAFLAFDGEAGIAVVPAFEAIGGVVRRDALAGPPLPREPVQWSSGAGDLDLAAWCRARGVRFARPGEGRVELHCRDLGAAPGRVVALASRLPTACGALAALPVAVGELELAACLAGLPLLRPAPRVAVVRLVGALEAPLAGADLGLELAIHPDLAAADVVEACGPGVETLLMDDRIQAATVLGTLTGTALVFPSDARTRAWLEARGRGADWKPLAGSEDAAPREIALGHVIARAARRDGGALRFVPAAETLIAGRTVVLGPEARLADAIGFVRALGTAGAPARVEVIAPDRAALEWLSAASGPLAGNVRIVDEEAWRASPGDGGGLAFGLPDDLVRARPGEWWMASPATCARAARGTAVPSAVVSGDEETVIATLESPRGHAVAASAASDAEPLAAEATWRLPRPLDGAARLFVWLGLGDRVGAHEVLAWGARLDPLRGRVPRLAAHLFDGHDPGFGARARFEGAGLVVAGHDFGVGAPHPLAAPALRESGVRAVAALSYGPDLKRRLVEAGVVPFQLLRAADRAELAAGDEVELAGLPETLEPGGRTLARVLTRGARFHLAHDLDARESALVRLGGWMAAAAAAPEA